MKRIEKSRWRKGSLTVETALWMPVILFVWMGAVSVCLFVHNRAWLTAVAYEAAIVGSWEITDSQEEAEERAMERVRMLAANSLYGSENIQVSVEERGNTLSVSMEGRHRFYGNPQWKFQVEGSRKICHPVSFIRKVRSLGQIGEQIGGSS